jgi:hypothetical protein
MKQGDLFPFEYVLAYDDGTAIDLITAESVKIYMTADETETAIVDGESCTITDASNGIIKYNWQSGETDDVGMYKIEFLITFTSGAILTVPSGDIIWMLILPSLSVVIP